MGRTKKKTSDEILEACCKVFWEKGFAQTSMKDLEEATGLKPGSFYHSFKNKEDLFVQVMQYYITNEVKPRIKNFLDNEENDPLVNLRNVFDSIIEIPCEHRWIGCLMTNSSLEVKQLPQIKEMIQGTFKKFEEGFLKQINRIANLKGRALVHRKKLASHLLLSMQGFFLLVRLGADDRQLNENVNDTFYFILN